MATMNWSDIGNALKTAAGDGLPLIGSLLGGPAGGAVGSMIASAIGVKDDPASVETALKANPALLEKVKELEIQQQEKLQELAVQAESNRLAADTSRLAEVNKTIRAEAESADPYVRRWRPTYGYVTSLTWLIEACAIAWAIVVHPAQAKDIIDAVAALTPMWGIALAILGINVSKRSQDKAVATGIKPASSILGALADRIAPSKQGDSHAS